MNNTSPHKARAAQEPGLVSLDSLAPALAARWTIGAFGRQRLYILSGRFGAERRFCSRYVVFPEQTPDQPRGDHWQIHVLNGEQDYTKGRLDILHDMLTETPSMSGHTEHSQMLGIADDPQQAQQECVEHAIAAGNGKALAEVEEETAQEVAAV